MTTGVGTTLTMGYDGLRRLTSVNGGPVSRQYTYRDIDSTKTTMQVASVTSGGQQYGYTYDSMGNIATYSAPGGWEMILPILKEVVEHADEFKEKAARGGGTVIEYSKTYVEEGVRVVVKIWISADGTRQQLSDGIPYIIK